MPNVEGEMLFIQFSAPFSVSTALVIHPPLPMHQYGEIHAFLFRNVKTILPIIQITSAIAAPRDFIGMKLKPV